MPRNERQKPDKVDRGGYQPLNEGYSPTEKRGYIPHGQGGTLPKAPVGGTGQTPSPTPSGPPKTPNKT